MHCLVKGLRCTTVILLLLLSAVAGVASVHAATHPQQQNDFSGVIVHQLPIPSLLQRITHQAVYTASPSIVVLADGGYLIACNEFGHGSSAATSGLTHLYRSDDRGASWQLVATLSDMKRGSLWQHPDGSLYLLGFRAAPGDILIRRSVDGGHAGASLTIETPACCAGELLAEHPTDPRFTTTAFGVPLVVGV